VFECTVLDFPLISPQIQPALNKLSTRELAETIGVTPNYVSGMKRGEDVAHPRFWFKLVEVLGVNL